MNCQQPQAHPDRCECQHPPFSSQWGGINVIRNDSLPAQTMIVSRDVFELLKSQEVKP